MSLSRAACLGSRARGLVEAGHVSRFTWRLGPSCRPPDGRGAERRGVADGGPSLEAGMGSFALLGPRAPPANGGEPPFLRFASALSGALGAWPRALTCPLPPTPALRGTTLVSGWCLEGPAEQPSKLQYLNGNS